MGGQPCCSAERCCVGPRLIDSDPSLVPTCATMKSSSEKLSGSISVFAAVMDGFDLAVRVGGPKASTLIARNLVDTGIVTVAAPSYVAHWGRPAKSEDLDSQRHRCLEFRNPETGKPFPWEFHRKRKRIVVDTRGRLTVNDPSALFSACLAGSGIAQMLLLRAEPLIADGRLINLFPEWADER